MQIGLSIDATNWIMGCVNSDNFSILFKGEPSNFKRLRGLRQGCPLSTLLFMLVVEVLSRLINQEKEEVKLEGVKVSMVLKITHLLFMDDVMISGKGSLFEWPVYKDILEFFCKAPSMAISDQKSTFLEYGLEDGFLNHLKDLFPYDVINLDSSIKYLCLYLKPNSYLKEDWCWLVRKLEKRITSWCNRWSSLGACIL